MVSMATLAHAVCRARLGCVEVQVAVGGLARKASEHLVAHKFGTLSVWQYGQKFNFVLLYKASQVKHIVALNHNIRQSNIECTPFSKVKTFSR